MLQGPDNELNQSENVVDHGEAISGFNGYSEFPRGALLVERAERIVHKVEHRAVKQAHNTDRNVDVSFGISDLRENRIQGHQDEKIG